MIKQNKNWLNHELSEWVARGWITAEGQQHIRERYHASGLSSRRFATPLYILCAVVGLAMLGVALIWATAYGWYHVDLSIRMAVSVLLLILSEGAVGTAVFQEKQGTLIGEIVALFHCGAVFASVALMGQAFYTGWDFSGYLLICTLLLLPAIYLLHSLAASAWYFLAAFVWAVQPGAVNAWGGTGFIWIFLVCAVPFYLLLMQRKDEKKLELFSGMTILSVYAAFWLTIGQARFIPLLLFSALAVVTMLVGSSINPRVLWGNSFRCLGRGAAALTVVAASLPTPWEDMIHLETIHWAGWMAAVILFVLMGVLYARGLKKHLWSPTVYMLIPLFLALCTFMARSGVRASLPASLSTVFLLGLGVFEIAKGLRDQNVRFVDWGLVLFFCFGAVHIANTAISQLTGILAVAVLAGFIWIINQKLKQRQKAALWAARKNGHHREYRTVMSVRKASNHQEKTSSPIVSPAEDQPEEIPEWMKSLKIPAPHVPVHHREDKKAEESERTLHKAEQAATVIPKPVLPPAFMPAPVFHMPEEHPVQVQQNHRPVKQEEQRQNDSWKRSNSSPWASMPAQEKRERHFTRSPWAKEGEHKK